MIHDSAETTTKRIRKFSVAAAAAAAATAANGTFSVL